MPSLNRVFLMGNLTRDPEVRTTPSGVSVADLGLAVSRRYRSNSGEEKEDRCFVKVSAWAQQAEFAGRYLRKGAAVYVEGRLQYDEWERDGERQTRLSVSAERLQALDGPKRTGEEPAAATGARPARVEQTGAEPREARDVPPAGEDPRRDEDDLPF